MMRFVFRCPVLFSPLVRLLLSHPNLYRKLKSAARGLWQVWGHEAMQVTESEMSVNQLPPEARQIFDQLQDAIATRRAGRP